MSLPSFLGPFVDVPIATSEAALTAPQPAGGNVLQFSMQGQQQSNWCWAATAASVSQYYGVNPVMTQCQIASKCLDMDCCITPLPPPPPPNWDGNITYALDVALRVSQHLAEGPTSDVLPFSSIMSEIDGGKPVCCHVSWDSDNGHFNAIVGYYNDDNQDVVVCDSLLGEHTLPYAMFVNNYNGGGTWDNSYLTK